VSTQVRPAAGQRSREDELEQLARAKDEFLAMVAHELRAPLAAIVGWVHLLRERRDEGDLESGLAVIEQSAQLQQKLIDDLLAMSRTAGESIAMESRLLDLRPVLDAVLDAVVPVAADKELRISRRYDANAGPVRGDATRLQQVLGNLVANAVKFTPPRGAIDVSLTRSRGWAVVAVKDEGVGIAPEFLPHVFDRFRQDPATARTHGGLGLGLAIARQLLELHGGEIEAHSAGRGRGATFVVRLPLAEVR
jgi:signal transduction histidine kinase